MSEREQHRGTTLLRPRRAGQAPPPSGPEQTPGRSGFWPLIVLVIAGTFALAAWALWPSASSDLDSAGSGYAGDWKDTVAAERADGGGDTGRASAEQRWDWKDRIVAERAEAASRTGDASSGSTGDWKDTVATERGTVTLERTGPGPR
jgi:hypothetical protein